MDDKKYSIIGKVEIGTDEYRDLIEGLIKAQKDYDSEIRAYWEASNRANKVEAKLKIAECFINSSEEIKSKYQLYLEERRKE